MESVSQKPSWHCTSSIVTVLTRVLNSLVHFLFQFLNMIWQFQSLLKCTKRASNKIQSWAKKEFLIHISAPKILLKNYLIESVSNCWISKWIFFIKPLPFWDWVLNLTDFWTLWFVRYETNEWTFLLWKLNSKMQDGISNGQSMILEIFSSWIFGNFDICWIFGYLRPFLKQCHSSNR